MGASHNGQTLAVAVLLAGGANVNLQNGVCERYLSNYCLVIPRHLFGMWYANCKIPE